MLPGLLQVTVGLSHGPGATHAEQHGRNVQAEEPGCLVKLLVPSHPSCVILGKFFNFSEAQFHHLRHEKTYLLHGKDETR